MMKLGLILPHFGRHATTSRLLDGVSRIERLGFNSVWVRDHVVYRPHEFEDADITFNDAFVVLAAAAAKSERLTLGTATLIPFRHPVHSAALIASLARYVGPDRLLICWGMGNDPREFAATGNPEPSRGARLDEHVDIVRRLLSGTSVSHHGRFYDFDDVRIAPPPGAVPFWYGGGTERAMERTSRGYDGLLASRIPRPVLRQRIEQLSELSERAGREPPAIGVVTLVSPGKTIEDGLGFVDVERVRGDTERRFPAATWNREPGFDGVIIAGPGEQIASELAQFEDLGVEHLVIDLRARFAEWEAVVDLIAKDVLPLFRRR